MPETAREYHLEVSTTVDERLDVIKATEAACNYLKKKLIQNLVIGQRLLQHTIVEWQVLNVSK